jgi:hypothetical protein
MLMVIAFADALQCGVASIRFIPIDKRAIGFVPGIAAGLWFQKQAGR